MGYTQQSWDDESGKEKQPASAKKYWAKLTDAEKAAAMVLGYTERIWDKGGKKDQPASADKYWAELTSCESIAVTTTNPPSQGQKHINVAWSLIHAICLRLA